jgi:hypothetical protein
MGGWLPPLMLAVMPTEVNRVPLALQLAAIVSASAIVLRTVDERALSAGLYAANIWNVIFWAGVVAVLVSFGRWPGAAAFQKPLWLALAGSFVLCLCLGFVHEKVRDIRR